MEWLASYAKELFALLTSVVAWYVTILLRPRAKLVRGVPHEFTFLIHEPLTTPDGRIISPTQTVNICSHLLVNTGRETATGIEVVFNWKPQYWNMWPIRSYSERTSPDGRYSIILDNMAPKEGINFELLAVNSDMPSLVTVRCEQCVAVKIPLQPQEILPRWKVGIIFWLLITGFAANAYLLAHLVQWLASS